MTEPDNTVKEPGRLLPLLVVEAILIAALIIAGTLNYFQQDSQNARLVRQETAISCRQAFLGRLAVVLVARQAAGDQTRTADLAYDKALTVTAAGSPDRDRAFTAYQAAISRVDAELAANAYPVEHCS